MGGVNEILLIFPLDDNYKFGTCMNMIFVRSACKTAVAGDGLDKPVDAKEICSFRKRDIESEAKTQDIMNARRLRSEYHAKDETNSPHERARMVPNMRPHPCKAGHTRVQTDTEALHVLIQTH